MITKTCKQLKIKLCFNCFRGYVERHGFEYCYIYSLFKEFESLDQISGKNHIVLILKNNFPESKEHLNKMLELYYPKLFIFLNGNAFKLL